MSKKMNPELARVLVMWGEWRRGEVRGLESLGYPSITVEARLYISPGISTVPHKAPNYWPDRTAKWVEKKLQYLEPINRNALWCRFVQCLEDDRASEAMGMDKLKFRDIFDKSIKLAGDALNMRVWIWSS